MTAAMNGPGRAEIVAWAQTIHDAWQRSTGPPAGRPDAVAGLPAPPSEADLLRDYQVDDQPLIKMGNRTAALAEANASLYSDKSRTLFNPLGLDWLNGMKHIAISDAASAAAKDSFGGTGQDGKANGGTGDNHRDAFRHAYWNALMSREFGGHNAAAVGAGHERRPDEPGATPEHEARAEAMDLYNNKIGREIANSLGPDASDGDVRTAVEQAVRDGKLVMFNEDRTALVPSGVPR